MRSLALVIGSLAWGTGCTIHVVEQPAVAMAQPTPVYYQGHPAPARVARPAPARPIHRQVEPARPPRPSRPAPVATVEKPRPVVPSAKPREPRPTQVAAKPRPTKTDTRPVRPVRDARPPARDARPPVVAKPGAGGGSQHEHADSQHERAHAMER